jgi:hypothetical protein
MTAALVLRFDCPLTGLHLIRSKSIKLYQILSRQSVSLADVAKAAGIPVG